MANELKQFNSKEIVSEEIDMQSYINSLVNELREDVDVCEHLRELKLSNKEVRQNIARLTDYKDDYNYCKNCPGIANCRKASPHTSIRLVKEGSFLTTAYEPCVKLVEQITIDSKYMFKDFPAEWKTFTFKSLDLSENRRPVIKHFVDILKGNSKKSVYVYGNHKVGKSLLLVTFANEFVARNLGQVAVIDACKRFKQLADLSYSDKETFEKQIVSLSEVSLLIIDNFGSEYINDFMRDQVVLPILSERNRSSKLTFFCSDLTIDEIQKLYSGGKNGGEIRGKQIANIIRDMCDAEYDLTGVSIYKK